MMCYVALRCLFSCMIQCCVGAFCCVVPLCVVVLCIACDGVFASLMCLCYVVICVGVCVARWLASFARMLFFLCVALRGVVWRCVVHYVFFMLIGCCGSSCCLVVSICRACVLWLVFDCFVECCLFCLVCFVLCVLVRLFSVVHCRAVVDVLCVC